jgi:hypothetical protein
MNVAYRDYISYLPAMMLFINMILLLIFRVNPHCFDHSIHNEAEADEQSDHETDDPTVHHLLPQDSSKAAMTPTFVRKIKGKYQKFKTVYKGVIDSLTLKQHQLAQLTQFTMRFEGLYKWRTPSLTVMFFSRTFIAFVVMTVVPFRYVFPVIVVDQVHLL